MFNIKDNAEWKLKMWVSSTGTTIVLNDWEGVKFPEAPFLVVLNKRNSEGKITKYETIEIEAIIGDQMTIKTRWYEWTTATDFSVWDFVSLFILSKHINDIKDELENLDANKVDKTEVAGNLKWTAKTVLTFDLDWNLQQIPRGNPWDSLVISPNWIPKFWTAKSEVSYLSAKRELGEDIDTTDWPKAYFLGSWTEIVNVANDKNIDVGKNNTNKFLKLKNNWYINKLNFTVDTVWNPNEQLLLEPCDIVEDTTIYTKYSDYSDAEYTIVSFSWKKMQYINIKYKTPSDSYWIIKIKDGSTVLKQQSVGSNTTTIIEHDFWGTKTNINISIYFPSNHRTHTLSNIRWVEQKNGIQHIITKWTNIIPQIYAKCAVLTTIWTSSNHYYTLYQSNDRYLSGEYTLGYESWKKYISNPEFPSSSRVDGIEVVGGTKWETTTGIEGWVYELPEGVRYTWALYANENGSLTTTDTGVYVGEGLGNYIRLQKNTHITTTIATSATTGTVALGKAKWYMSIVGQDGKTYKIPVYDN